MSYDLEQAGNTKHARNIKAESFEIAKTIVVNYWIKKDIPMFADNFVFEGEFNGQMRVN